MKKSIIALSMLAVFGSASVSAASISSEYASVQDVEDILVHAEKNNGIKVERDGFNRKITGVNGKEAFIKVDARSGDVTVVDADGNSHSVEVSKKGKIMSINGIDAAIERKIDVNNDVINPKDDTENAHQNDIADNRNKAENNASDIRKIRDELDKNSKAAYDVVEKEYTAAAKHVAKQDARITTLEQDFSKMAQRQDALENRMDKVEKKMDSVMAGVHAVTNARPFVQDGQTAVGVGTGFAGSAQSVAIGAAHSFEDSAWSMSASMNVTTGSGVKTDVSGGVGAHYVF